MATTIQEINGFYTGNNYLTIAQQSANAVWIASYLTAIPNTPWTSYEAIAALCGNASQESNVNPGFWEGKSPNLQRGFGLLQWTPATKYRDWCYEQSPRLDPAYMDSALLRVLYEMRNNLQWIPVRLFDYMTFYEFAANEKGYPLDSLVNCFMRSYERPALETANLENRRAKAAQFLALFQELSDDGTLPLPSVPASPSNPTAPGQYWFNGKYYMYLPNKGKLSKRRK